MSFLRSALTPRALAAWAGTDRLSALPLQMPPPRASTPAAALLELFVGGATVPRHPRWPDFGELVEETAGMLRAKVSVLPLGRGLVVCDRLDTDDTLAFVCWPDDSSYHLAAALPPGRRASWLDLGCGSATAQLQRPDAAARILAADLNPRATQYAQLGLALSGITHVDLVTADLARGISGRFELVTCNAPIPGQIGSHWRATDHAFFPRLYEDAARCVDTDGIVIIHGALDALCMPLPGERIVVAYTPEDMFGFGVLWWRPSAPDRFVRTRRALTADRPHLSWDDRLAVV